MYEVNNIESSVKLNNYTECMWNKMETGFLSHAAYTGDRLADLLEADPENARVLAAKGMFLMLLGRAELRPEAVSCWQKAVAAYDPTHADRYCITGCLCDALSQMISGHWSQAALQMDAKLTELSKVGCGSGLLMKLVQSVRFMLGDAAGMRRSLVSAQNGFDAAHPMRGYYLGCAAFALEETGSWEEAEAAGRAGLELSPDDAWGLHAVAHIYDMRGQADEGVRWLATRAKHWKHCNNFGQHVWWHLALFHLDRGAFIPALELYDRKVRAELTDDYRDIANAASLLLRLECEGVDVGRRWEELGNLCANRCEDGSVVFADLHYLTALIRAGKPKAAAALTAHMAKDADLASMPAEQGARHDRHEVVALAGLPAATALMAFKEGSYGQAARGLAAVLPKLQVIGGSHAQRDLFERLAIEGAMRANAFTLAQELLDARRLRRGGVADGYEARRSEQISQRLSASRLLEGV